MTIKELLIRINNYESNICINIKTKAQCFQPKVNWELKRAVDKWCSNKKTAIVTYGHISTWDIRKITSISGLFQCPTWCVPNPIREDCSCGKRYFNDNINDWDVSNVVDMSYIFNGCIKFNQPLNKWNISNAKDMSMMFANTASFDQDISNWEIKLGKIAYFDIDAGGMYYNSNLKSKNRPKFIS